jgi:hypothetical protein
MLKHIVHSKALHNRKTFEIKLPPLPASEARLFFKNLRSDFEIAKFLMVFGGIPKYMEQLDPRLSFSDNVDRLCFQKNGFFVNEFENTASNNGCSGFDLSKMGGDFIGDIISFLEMFEESADAVL